MKHLSEMELVDRINQKDKEAFDDLFELYWAALVFLAEQLIGEKDSEMLANNVFIEIRKSEKQFVDYRELELHLYNLAIDTIINHANNQPFGIGSAIKIQKEAKYQALYAESLRKKLLAQNRSK